MILLGNGKLITRGTPGYYPDGCVAMEGALIAEVGETAALRAKYPDAEFVDALGGVIMPGLINAHTHIYSALARGLSINGYNPHDFYEILDGQWWYIDRNLDLEATKCSAYATILDCIKQGVTTIFDHHASYCEVPGSLFAIADAAKELGMRACLCYEVSDRDGEQKCLEGIRENAEFAKWCDAQSDPMLRGMFGMHALFTLSDKTFERCAEANNGRTGYHIHVSEGTNDVEDSLAHHGCRPVQRLERFGILRPDTILGHCIHADDAELDLIKKYDTMVVTNPESNMGNAVGVCPVLRIWQKDILIGLGTDAYTHDMLESLKVELLIQRHNAKDARVGWGEATGMLFSNNARIGGRIFGQKMGVLEAGANADVIVMDYKPFTPFSDANIDGHMLFGMTGRQCQTTVIAGKVVMKDRQLVGIDEEALNARICASAEKLWHRLNG